MEEQSIFTSSPPLVPTSEREVRHRRRSCCVLVGSSSDDAGAGQGTLRDWFSSSCHLANALFCLTCFSGATGSSSEQRVKARSSRRVVWPFWGSAAFMAPRGSLVLPKLCQVSRVPAKADEVNASCSGLGSQTCSLLGQLVSFGVSVLCLKSVLAPMLGTDPNPA